MDSVERRRRARDYEYSVAKYYKIKDLMDDRDYVDRLFDDTLLSNGYSYEELLEVLEEYQLLPTEKVDHKRELVIVSYPSWVKYERVIHRLLSDDELFESPYYKLWAEKRYDKESVLSREEICKLYGLNNEKVEE